MGYIGLASFYFATRQAQKYEKQICVCLEVDSQSESRERVHGPAFTYSTYSLDLSEFKFKFLSGMILFLCLLCGSIVRTALRCPCHAMQWVNEYVLVSICTPDFGFVHRKSQRYERNLTDWTITNNKPATVLHLTMHRTFMRFASEQTKMYAKRMFIPQNNSNRNRNSSDRLSGLFIWILSASASASSSLVCV